MTQENKTKTQKPELKPRDVSSIRPGIFQLNSVSYFF